MSQIIESDGKDSAVIIKLPAVVTISETATLREDLLYVLVTDNRIAIDASAVQRIDTAGLQLLAAFVESINKRECLLSWRGTTDALRDGAERLGLAGQLRLNDNTPGAGHPVSN